MKKNKIKEIVFLTLRDNKGATGGPGGVLFLQKQMLGEKLLGIPCKYQFNILAGNLGKLKNILNKILFFFKYSCKNNVLYFTHDTETAYLLAKMNKNYSMLYHNQGPIVEERLNLGEILKKSSIKKWEKQERIAFLSAKSIHFPSNGAAEMYFNSKYANCKIDEVNLYPPLYNIIPMVEPIKTSEVNLDYDDEYITLFSLGTLTKAKGQDQTISFLKEYAYLAEKPLRYILVGRGPMKEELLGQLKKLKEEVNSFNYFYFESLSHDSVMYLHKISDIYIMLHRISIFDFATLEAMSQRSAIILSKVGGNVDFDKNNNIIFAEDIYSGKILLKSIDLESLKERNFQVFVEYFSKEAFIKQYRILFNKLLNIK